MKVLNVKDGREVQWAVCVCVCVCVCDGVSIFVGDVLSLAVSQSTWLQGFSGDIS